MSNIIYLTATKSDGAYDYISSDNGLLYIHDVDYDNYIIDINRIK